MPSGNSQKLYIVNILLYSKSTPKSNTYILDFFFFFSGRKTFPSEFVSGFFGFFLEAFHA